MGGEALEELSSGPRRMLKRRDGMAVIMYKYLVNLDKNADIVRCDEDAFRILVKLLRVKPGNHGFIVKPNDIRIYLGISDHHSLTTMGRFLSKLAKHGLAKRLNNSRPIHYALDPLVFLEVLDKCREDKIPDYCISSGCSLLGICPYWKVKKYGKGDHRGDN